MRNKLFILILALSFSLLLAACGDSQEDELLMLEVDFEPPKTATVGESIELEAIVTYGDEPVTDAREMNFEYWLGDDKENSTTVDSTNNGDGTYTVEVTFEEEGEYSIYAHTTAHDQHTMPKRTVTVNN